MYPTRSGKYVAKFGVDTEQRKELIVNIAVLLSVRDLEVNQDPQTDFTKIERFLKYVKITIRLLEQNRTEIREETSVLGVKFEHMMQIMDDMINGHKGIQ
jgi:hypothetical protein